MRGALLGLLACLGVPGLATACDTALMLTIDVSNSVDTAEYRLQAEGLADALTDPDIVDALVRGQGALSVVQWSGVDRQSVAVPWTRIRSALDVARLSDAARLMPRAYTLSGTAPAQAILFSLSNFGPVMDCKRRVIDISGDGTPNTGGDVAAARRQAERDGITINAIAIESMGQAITNFYARQVITRDGFVMTARMHRDYPRAIRAKILRELTRVIS
ncbi:Ca-activated chloride channel family protein [Loktanella atrilutea]|jgi:Ca-activated chloride channel family protein|uniref:Ca-activated chloride channel family protein n=1 Tax=Loktanella atrilutea TaxID=366533 RepID=A0A1M4UGY3_LOKAT|nr:DUF1194 domain-containing protein [Loktanella atrilutea]SHE55935.1 Ca-activated chloride channel family protein [Loktanella atrilutea]